MNRETMPDENTQAETYRGIVEAMNGDPVSDPRAGLGRREGHRGAVERRHRAGHRRRQSGAGPARHPAAAAPAGAVGDAIRRHPACSVPPVRCACCCRW